MSVIELSDYQILNLLGKGQNPVYRVKSRQTDHNYALKKVRRNEFQHHLVDLQEVLYLIQSDHPNIIKVLGFSMAINKTNFGSEYILYVLMPLMTGTLADDLKKRQESNNPYNKSELTRITVQILSALVYLQKKTKLAHRDIKPDNVLLDESQNCYLTDFGECFWPSKFKPKASTLVGSPYYLAPELKEIYVMEGIESMEYDPWKSDIWSFGMTLVDLATTTYAGKEPLEIKLEKIEKLYGSSWRSFIRKLLKKDEKLRPDFIEIENSKELKLILSEEGLSQLTCTVNSEDSLERLEAPEEPEDFREEIDCLSQGVFSLFKKIERNNGLNEQLEEEFDQIIAEVEEMEGRNMELKLNYSP